MDPPARGRGFEHPKVADSGRRGERHVEGADREPCRGDQLLELKGAGGVVDQVDGARAPQERIEALVQFCGHLCVAHDAP